MTLRTASKLAIASQNMPDKELVSDLMSSLKESMNLAGKTSQLLNQVRRDLMKPMLPKQFAKLATDNDEVSEFFFRTSVCDRIETLTKENKLASMLDKEKSSKRKYNEGKQSNNIRTIYFNPGFA